MLRRAAAAAACHAEGGARLHRRKAPSVQAEKQAISCSSGSEARSPEGMAPFLWGSDAGGSCLIINQMGLSDQGEWAALSLRLDLAVLSSTDGTPCPLTPSALLN